MSTTTVARAATAVVAIAIGFVLVSAGTADASCAPPPPLEESISSADVVFVGTVTSVSDGGRIAEFRVEEVWKGAVEAQVVVHGSPVTGAVATSVDRTYQPGVTYLVVPTGHEHGRFLDNACTATQVFSSDLGELRPADAGPPTAPDRNAGTPLWRTILVIAVALAATGAVAVAARRITKHPRRSVSA